MEELWFARFRAFIGVSRELAALASLESPMDVEIFKTQKERSVAPVAV
jgi:hypothetical protein